MPQLVMGVHTVEAATAKVPFSMILLLDHVKRRTIPDSMKVRMVVPSDGNISISLWDVEDIAALKEWLDENLGTDCVSEIFEVQEEFTYGLSLELVRARAAEKVGGSTKKTIGAIGEHTSKAAEMLSAGMSTAAISTQQRLDDWDKKTGVLTSAKETTAATYNKLSTAVAKAAENENVKHVVSNVQTGAAAGWKKVSAGLGWVGGHVAKMTENAMQGLDDPEYRDAPQQAQHVQVPHMGAAGHQYGTASREQPNMR
eukprot:jgi/Chrzof1/8744/Cz03g22220.t1